ncbi:MAG: hypothetical protein MJ219_00185 [Mycoplasmoidaceae bacterium]|nr:hypothetical protein [Mycoplasmoidaceae bacterium]
MGTVTVEGEVEKQDGRTIFKEDPNGNCRYIPMHPDIQVLQKEIES